MRRTLVIALVVLATLAGIVGTLAVVSVDRELSVGTVRLSVEPFHEGALDLYVPLVDWGVRFPQAVRAPMRVGIDVRTIDREAAFALAQPGALDLERVRDEARDALAAYLRLALALAALGGLAAGGLVALAVRGGRGPRLRVTLGAAAITATALTVLLVVLLPPRGGGPERLEYYANGPEVPRALRAIETLGAARATLDEELDGQLVGIARLVAAPAGRSRLEGLPRLTVASDLHNNVVALPALAGAARGAPLLFAGDLTDRGSRLESALVRRVVGAGDPFVFVAGNHDSDDLARRLARDGAVVLTRAGRLRADGGTGAVVVRVGGLRVAGYDDPLGRRAADGLRDRGSEPTRAQQEAFAAWVRRLAGRVDVVMVHSPALATVALEGLREQPTAAPLLLVTGHTHTPSLERRGPVTVVNGGSVGGGGTGNLGEGGGPIGVGRLIYRADPRFEPLAVDLVEIDPGDGSARAQRFRLDDSSEGGDA